jgi:hypothetical protein
MTIAGRLAALEASRARRAVDRGRQGGVERMSDGALVDIICAAMTPAERADFEAALEEDDRDLAPHEIGFRVPRWLHLLEDGYVRRVSPYRDRWVDSP